MNATTSLPQQPSSPDRVLKLRERVADPRAVEALTSAGIDPLLARLMAARGMTDANALNDGLQALTPPGAMRGLSQAASMLADAIDAGESICVVGDYDCDGATATAVSVLGLRLLGARVDYLVPNRLTDGYGLSPGVVSSLTAHPRLGRPAWIMTVDNGISSLAGVRAAQQAGIRVIVTDHHLPGDELPSADAIVNPNLPDCPFPDKHLAGVGVAFYVLAAVRQELRHRCRLPEPAPRLGELLDLVAVGTIADVVRLSDNNRRLVRAGLQRLRSGRARPGLRALIRVAGCDEARLTVRDLGFAIGPRINAAGRLDDITIGIECLLASDPGYAEALAGSLDDLNQQRRQVESEMREVALESLPVPSTDQMSVAIVHPDWHEGVVGLVASRLREQYHRPVMAMAPAAGESGQLRGSGRSIPGVHLRDVLALVDARHPGLITRFGGHAMAAGMSLPVASTVAFCEAFEVAVRELASDDALQKELLTDGPLHGDQISLRLCQLLDDQIWGQGFAAPVFCNEFELQRQRVVGNGHLKLDLRLDGKAVSGIYFRRTRPLPDRPVLAYQLESNLYGGLLSPQVVVQACANG